VEHQEPGESHCASGDERLQRRANGLVKERGEIVGMRGKHFCQPGYGQPLVGEFQLYETDALINR